MKCSSGRIGVFCVLAVAACVVLSCAGNRPRWYLNPPESNDRFYGTGASEQTASQSLGRQVADANARTDLAMSIQVSVQAMLRTFLQQSGTIDTTRVLQFSEAVSKQVVDVKLSGVRIVERQEINNVYYSLAEVSMDSVRNALLSAVRDAAAEFSELKARQSFDDLSREIEQGQIPIIRQ
ncbi:LPP20 family lipoprotein [Candidatus Latescibacterota bacterium]